MPVTNPEHDALRSSEAVVDDFHRLYYDSDVWRQTYWLGIRTAKCPLDLWVYQEILFELMPDLIIECGTAWGGSALYLASVMDLLGNGSVISVDIDHRADRPSHPRITYLHGSSTSTEVVGQVTKMAATKQTVMVILDSDHSFDHVRAELSALSGLVTEGSYLIVEDGSVNGHPVLPDFGPGPMEAVEDFLPDHDEFSIDLSRQKFFLTFNPKGFLRRTGAG